MRVQVLAHVPADHTYQFEVVDHDARGLKIAGKTIRMKIDGGDWH